VQKEASGEEEVKLKAAPMQPDYYIEAGKTGLVSGIAVSIDV